MSDQAATVYAILLAVSVPLAIVLVAIVRIALLLSHWDGGRDEPADASPAPIVVLITPEQIRQRAASQRQAECEQVARRLAVRGKAERPDGKSSRNLS